MNTSPKHSHLITRRTAVQAGAVGISAMLSSSANVFAASANQEATPLVTQESEQADRVTQAVSALETLIPEMLDTTGVPGLSVAVVYRDEVLVAQGYGVTSTETNAPVDADTIFQLASVSKPIASTVVASIVGDGLVTWDTKIIDHFPEFRLHDSWVTNQVTIRDMLTHRSGLPDHAGDVLEDMGYDREAVLHRLRYLPLATSTRSTHAYTNFGFTAGAETASNADSTTWEDASVARLYQPAGMTRTSSLFEDFISDENHASGHIQENGAWIPRYVRQPDPQSPAGGVSSTATDMAQWLRLQLGRGMLDGVQIIPSDALDETHRPQSFSRPAANPAVDHTGLYGLGWNVGYDSRGAVQLSHSGAFGIGAGTTVFMLPAEEVGIVVLTNGAPVGLAEAVGISFLDIVTVGEVLNDYLAIFGPIMEEALRLPYGQDVDYSVPPVQPSSAQAAATYTGTYNHDYYGPVEISADGDELTLSQGPLPNTYPLTHWDRDTFLYVPEGENANALSAVTFSIGPDGNASHVRIENLDVDGLGTFTRDNDTD